MFLARLSYLASLAAISTASDPLCVKGEDGAACAMEEHPEDEHVNYARVSMLQAQHVARVEPMDAIGSPYSEATVITVRTVSGPKNDNTGQYFDFTGNEWTKLVTDSEWNAKTYNVNQWRWMSGTGKKECIWSGVVKVFDEEEGDCGRRNVGHQASQWAAGDTITLNSIPVLTASFPDPTQEGGQYFWISPNLWMSMMGNDHHHDASLRVTQRRNGKPYWAGDVSFYETYVGVYGSRSVGDHTKQWQKDDEIIGFLSGHVNVDTTKHPDPKYPVGQFFFFDADAWCAMVGSTKWFADGKGEFFVEQKRNGVEKKTGYVTIWNNEFGISGRWSEGQQGKDWEAGDAIYKSR